MVAGRAGVGVVMAAALALAGCAGGEPPRTGTADPATGTACPAPGGWSDTAGHPLAAGPLLRRAAAAPAVLLGERHDSAEQHRWQLHTIAALHALNPGLAIGLEMMPRRAQPALDRWVAGATDEPGFLRDSDWDRVWGYDPALYLPVLHFARMHRLPLVALNVDRSLVSRTAREGWAAIPPADREGVGDPAPPPPAYRERLTAIMAAHGSGTRQAPDPARFIEAQSVWDRAMAEAIADTHRTTGRTVVALVGAAHAERREGVPHQLAELGLPASVVLLPWEGDRPCDELAEGLADALFGLAAEAETTTPRLGLALESAANGVAVRRVGDGSIAAAAGVRVGDVITGAAGRPVRAAGELTAIVRRQPPGTWLPLTVTRGGKTRTLVARFPAG